MARIRIVDVWLRSPASPPSQYRSIMVIAEKWAEQRVMMRAYAESRDQTRPTIMLHGAELAIGPAGLDPQGPWGIHAPEHVEGHAQSIKSALEEAARRLAGSKGNPPRLVDEESTFEREPTGNWAPGSPSMVPGVVPGVSPSSSRVGPAGADRIGAASASRVGGAMPATFVPAHPGVQHYHAATPAPPQVAAAPPSNPGQRLTPVRSRPASQGPHGGNGLARTALGYASGAGAQSAVIRLGLQPAVSARLGRLVDRVVPADFQITKAERAALNALGSQDVMTAHALGQLVDSGDPVAFMEQLIQKLESFGLDVIEPGEPRGGEPTYRLRR
jgi:hypothetical protein